MDNSRKEYSEEEFYRTLPQLITVRESKDSVYIKWRDGLENIFPKDSEKYEWFQRIFVKNKDYRS